tara:strand:- start:895 stop:1677 length:783 start_codon:yes stop_codon:yes gene_type:complete
MDRDTLKSMVKDAISQKNQKLNLVEMSGFNRVNQLLMGNVPSVDHVGIMTAENPGGQPASSAENKERNQQLMQDLRDMNLGPIPVKGRYGSMENSYLIPNITRDEIIDLGMKYDQEAVIWGDRISDQDSNPFLRFQYIEGDETIQQRDVSLRGGEVQGREDFYSEKKGRKFWIPFFDDQYEDATFADQGRRISFAESEIPNTKEARRLSESIKYRANLIKQANRTRKSRWHHRGALKEEVRTLQRLINYETSRSKKVDRT